MTVAMTLQNTQQRTGHTLFVYGLAFCSGFAVMAVELLGGRILAPYFGGSIYVWGSIITVFMLSLSLGYLAGGRWSLKNPTLPRFGRLFFGGSLALLPIVFWSDTIMDAIFLRLEDPRYGSLVAAMALFFLPTAILGMISPYSVRLLVSGHEHSGHIAGRLYFVSTLGSALGTLLTSFYLVLWLEVNTIVGSLCLILFGAGLAASVLGRWRAAHD